MLTHLRLRDRVYAESTDGRFYALRALRNECWTLVDRDGVFRARNHNTLQDADEACGRYIQQVA
jgi:hypothetical protein